MSDVCLTVPKNFRYHNAPGRIGLAAWAAEGDLPGQPESGIEWEFTTWGQRPDIVPGDRVYIVCEGRLRGYAPLTRLYADKRGGAYCLSFIRRGGAVAVTIPTPIIGFRGWRYRWWDRAEEVPFRDWLSSAPPEQKRLI